MPLRAGPLTLRYDTGDLRDIRIGDVDVVRRIYMVFQDRNWTARPWQILDEEITVGEDHFSIALTAMGTFDATPFTWHGVLTGDCDGTVRMRVRGRTSARFLRNRLGLCVLHPIVETRGQPVTIEHVDGSIEHSIFPDVITPDQPFRAVRAITHEPLPGWRVCVRMTGDTFETEDHRNWSDASFKHYCTPIDVPFPVVVAPADVIEQQIAIDVRVPDGLRWPTAADEDADPVRLHITDERMVLPALGIQLDADGHVLTTRERERIRELALAHVRVDLQRSDDPAGIDAALAEADELGVALVPALIGADPAAFAQYRDDPRIARWLVFDPERKVSGADVVAAARPHLGSRVGGGSNLYYTELNRERPTGLDMVAFSVNPQVHASDDQSVMQNAMTQGVIARNARMHYPSAFLEISPITLRPRFNPNATAPEFDVSNSALPAHVDARQATPFAAAWLVLSLKAIGESGCIDAVTYFQATGWQGLMERASGSPQPSDFPSIPGEPFAVFDVFRALAGVRRIRRVISSDPRRVDALALESGLLLIANLTDREHEVLVRGQAIRVRPYDIATVRTDPDDTAAHAPAPLREDPR